MEYQRPRPELVGCTARDAAAMTLIVDDILREEAWWIAARSGLYAHTQTVWVDRGPEDQANSVDVGPPPYWVEGPCDRREQG